MLEFREELNLLPFVLIYKKHFDKTHVRRRLRFCGLSEEAPALFRNTGLLPDDLGSGVILSLERADEALSGNPELLERHIENRLIPPGPVDEDIASAGADIEVAEDLGNLGVSRENLDYGAGVGCEKNLNHDKYSFINKNFLLIY